MEEKKYVDVVIEFPRDLLEEIDRVIEKTGCSFDEFILGAMEYASGELYKYEKYKGE